jgi:hypothetical protein
MPPHRILILQVPGCPLVDQLITLVDEALTSTGVRAHVEIHVGPHPSPTLVIDGTDVARVGGWRARLDVASICRPVIRCSPRSSDCANGRVFRYQGVPARGPIRTEPSGTGSALVAPTWLGVLPLIKMFWIVLSVFEVPARADHQHCRQDRAR